MSIHVTRAPTLPLTSYDTKRSSQLEACFVSHIFCLKNGGFDFQYLKSKHKIYILSKNVLLRI